jgi:hypothetical protein
VPTSPTRNTARTKEDPVQGDTPQIVERADQSFLTNPAEQPDISLWQTQLAFRLAD